MPDKKEETKEIKQVTAKIKCPKCGHEYEVRVEKPEEPKTPKMGYQG